MSTLVLPQRRHEAFPYTKWVLRSPTKNKERKNCCDPWTTLNDTESTACRKDREHSPALKTISWKASELVRSGPSDKHEQHKWTSRPKRSASKWRSVPSCFTYVTIYLCKITTTQGTSSTSRRKVMKSRHTLTSTEARWSVRVICMEFYVVLSLTL